jgi:hypothetical protein
MQPAHWAYMKEADRNALGGWAAIHKRYSDCTIMQVV